MPRPARPALPRWPLITALLLTLAGAAPRGGGVPDAPLAVALSVSAACGARPTARGSADAPSALQFVSARLPAAPPALQTRLDMRLRVGLTNVWTGAPGGGELTRAPGDGWQALPGGSRVTTDRDGEGWLQFAENRRECGTLYVFQQTSLTVDKCPKSLRAAGNSVCNTGGAAAYRNSCRSELVLQSPSARLRVQGTWVGLVYLPERQLSLVLLFEGRAQAQPVRAVNGDTLGRATPLGAGVFWFTSPDGTPASLAGFARGGTYPLGQLPGLIEALRPSAPTLLPWVRRIVDRARLDGVAVPGLLTEYVQPQPRREPREPRLPEPSEQPSRPGFVGGNRVGLF